MPEPTCAPLRAVMVVMKGLGVRGLGFRGLGLGV